MTSSIGQSIEILCSEQGLDRDMVIEAMKDAVKAAARKQFKDKTGDSVQVDWNNEEGAIEMHRKLREDPLDDGRFIEVGRRCRRFRTAVCTSGLTNLAQQGKPELLGVLLVALHSQHGEPVPLRQPAGPRAQQRRLPAASRGRDDRHLPGRRPIQQGEEITAVNQPWS